MDTQAKSATVQVAPDQTFSVVLRADQINLLLKLISQAHFPGKESHLVASIIDSIQDPVLAAAHTGKQQ